MKNLNLQQQCNHKHTLNKQTTKNKVKFDAL
jgi:hypothetical protein